MTTVTPASTMRQTPRAARPRLGFLGVGWIGRSRMERIAQTDCADLVAVMDPSDEAVSAALAHAPDAKRVPSVEALLEEGLDGVVIATPSAQHAAQAIAALERGCAVFCQKPLGRTSHETKRVIEIARRNDALLAVDLSYRRVEAVQRVREVVRRGELGQIYALDLVFHNAYGPDKPWFFDPQQSGGGCLMDLGIHLVDLGLWMLDRAEVTDVRARLFADGQSVTDPDTTVETFAECQIDLAQGPVMRLACSWNLSAGCDAVIELHAHGTEGGATVRNVDGSFFDFRATQHRGTRSTVLSESPDDWFGKAAAEWAQRLADGQRYDESIEQLIPVAQTLDRLYGRTPCEC